MTLAKGSYGGDLPEEAFQRGTPCGAASPHVSGPVDDATNRVSSCPPVPVPLTLLGACFSANLGAFNPRSYTLTDSGDSFGGPTPTTSQGSGEHARPFPKAVKMIGGIQLSGPCEPHSGGRLVLGLAYSRLAPSVQAVAYSQSLPAYRVSRLPRVSSPRGPWTPAAGLRRPARPGFAPLAAL